MYFIYQRLGSVDDKVLVAKLPRVRNIDQI